MAMSMYGMGNTMVDSCGSLGKMDLELCARWMQMAAFMPMVRNFYNETYTGDDGKKAPTDPSEPNVFKGDDGLEMAYKSALSNRLLYLRYIYSELY